MIADFIADALKCCIAAAIFYDSPKYSKLTAKQREHLQKRIAPYGSSSNAVVGLCLLVFLLRVILTIYQAAQDIVPAERALHTFALSMLGLTISIGLFNAFLSLLVKRWRFADFHAAVAYRFDLGSGGCIVALALWHLAFITLALTTV
ncbi:MAG: hypothetical protein IKZ07_00915 [Akkermansia sp.]|nr:hypothetical protein [Akkermansia sp.]